jgi:hypothetical protein
MGYSPLYKLPLHDHVIPDMKSTACLAAAAQRKQLGTSHTCLQLKPSTLITYKNYGVKSSLLVTLTCSNHS